MPATTRSQFFAQESTNGQPQATPRTSLATLIAAAEDREAHNSSRERDELPTVTPTKIADATQNVDPTFAHLLAAAAHKTSPEKPSSMDQAMTTNDTTATPDSAVSQIPAQPETRDDAFFSEAPKLFIPGRERTAAKAAEAENTTADKPAPEAQSASKAPSAPEAQTEVTTAAPRLHIPARAAAAYGDATATAVAADADENVHVDVKIDEEQAARRYEEAIAKAQHDLVLERVRKASEASASPTPANSFLDPDDLGEAVPADDYPGTRHGFPTEAHRAMTHEEFNQRVPYNEQSTYTPAAQRYLGGTSAPAVAGNARAADLRGGLKNHLLAAGMPAHLLASMSPAAGMEALIPLLSSLPRCDLPLANPGMVALVIGPEDDCLEVGRRLSVHLECPRMGGDEVLLADRPDVARAQARSLRIGVGSGVVGITVRPYDQDPAYVAKTIASTSPGVVIACVDATRKQADSRAFLQGLARSGINVSGLAVTGARKTCEPAAVLELGIPVWEIDGAMADNLSWLPLLLRNYSDNG